jgi:hypothetical protein
MLLVPRQLMRSGMTGNVPYYGGRFSPRQAYAASHPSAASPPGPPPGPAPIARKSPVRRQHPSTTAAEKEQALRDLRDSGVLTPEEFADLMTRIDR